MQAGDWDQQPDKEDDEETLGVEVYNSAVSRTLKVILLAIERGATIMEIKHLCERGIAAFAKKGEDE